MDLAAGVLAGEARAVARAISLIEDQEPEAEALADALYPHTGRALVLGVTGSPGSGKSSLVDRLIARERRAGRRVAVVAVDPTSPFTGGAILGDRPRMQSHAADLGVCIRSMASRGSLDGVAAASGDVIKVLDAAGYPTIFLETVGVGQTEIKVAELSDIVLLVLMPGAGDEIQALKAVVMEIGDILKNLDSRGANRPTRS
jgi:LAO/AO transport system kinase